MRIRETFAAAGLLVVILACGPSLNAADRAELSGDGVRIGACTAIGVECKSAARKDGKDPAATCWPVFDACIADAGITPEGGKR